MNQVAQPALAINAAELVLDTNSAADGLLGRDIRLVKRRLLVMDNQAGVELERLIERLRVAREGQALPTTEIVVRRVLRLLLLICVLSVPPAARGPFLGACAILALSDLDERPAGDTGLRVGFGQAIAESALASVVEVGMSIERAAENLAIRRRRRGHSSRRSLPRLTLIGRPSSSRSFPA